MTCGQDHVAHVCARMQLRLSEGLGLGEGGVRTRSRGVQRGMQRGVAALRLQPARLRPVHMCVASDTLDVCAVVCAATDVGHSMVERGDWLLSPRGRDRGTRGKPTTVQTQLSPIQLSAP